MIALALGDRRLGAILLERGYLRDDDLQRALALYQERGGRLRDVLIEEGLVTERRITQVIEEAIGIPLVNLAVVDIPAEALAQVPAQTAQEYQAIPFGIDAAQQLLRVAFVDPMNSVAAELIEDLSGLRVEPYQVLRNQFDWALARNYPELELLVPHLEQWVDEQLEPIGQRLLRRSIITQAQLDTAINLQLQSGDPLGKILVGLGALSEEQLFEALAEQLGVPFLRSLETFRPPDSALASLLRSDVLRLQAVPIEDEGDSLLVVTSEPRNRSDIQASAARPVRLALSLPAEVSGLIERCYPERERIGEVLISEGALAKEQLRDALQEQRRELKSKPLGEVLVELGFVSREDVERAMAKQRAGGGRLEDTLVQSGQIKPEMLAQSLAVQLGYEHISLADRPAESRIALLIPEAAARRYQVVPHHLEGQALVVVMKDPRNVFALDDLKLVTGREIIPAVGSEREIQKAIERVYGGSDVQALNRELAQSRREAEAVPLDNLDDNAVVRVVDNVIREAVLAEASDIHIEPTEDRLRVRLRVDGALRDYLDLPKVSAPSVVARIKILGNLDIAERRLPQDGRVRFKKGNIDIDLRLSTLPTVYGEKVVMRLLQKAANIPEIEDLGFSSYNFSRFKDLIEKPYGIFLITGPTGSGKSFTTFSLLKRIARPEKNTTTIEDPVEYEISGINQTQVNPQAGLTFARALRAFLRQDPDIIMVGEVRDTETAKIAAEAALTGHLVIATLHTNDSVGAITRLAEMGVEFFNISAALIGVLAQRLVRRVCLNCRVEAKADPEVMRRLGIQPSDLVGAKLYRGHGCERCNGTGYRGRMAIHELLVIDDELRKAVALGQGTEAIRDLATSQSGLRSLRQDGLMKAMAGLTTLEEILGSTAN